MKVVLAVLLLAAPGLLGAQGDLRPTDPAAAATLRRNAERAARGFEQRRLRLLPNVPSSVGGPGDVIIGRYRYAAGEADDLTPPPTEPEEIAAARRALIGTLDSAAKRSPGDAWIRSRLVWYAIEAGDTTLALSAARDCRDDGSAWWCSALLGLALHVSGDFRAAETAFDATLAAMPDSTRCRWTDASVLLDGDAAR